ncbi:MAG: hypothetical protein QGH23_02545 [Dehalococcoidia bacterium]|nr:hypothetical protein [Dehalococcoidia bacterium]
MKRRRPANRRRRRREARWAGRKGQSTRMPWWLLGLLALVALAFGLSRALR